MSAGGHQSAAQIRSTLDHPVIDGDGHWVEFDPVFAERMRKVGGDRAADGFLAALKTTQDALSMSNFDEELAKTDSPLELSECVVRRALAIEARKAAHEMVDPEALRALLFIAAAYERLARGAEKRKIQDR